MCYQINWLVSVGHPTHEKNISFVMMFYPYYYYYYYFTIFMMEKLGKSVFPYMKNKDNLSFHKIYCGPRISAHAFPTRWQARFRFEKKDFY